MTQKFKYEFSVEKNTGKMKIDNLPEGVRVLYVPRDNKDDRCISYILHEEDLLYCIFYLDKALKTEDTIIKEALFESALIRYIKCFTSSKSGRKQLNENVVYKNYSGDPIGCHRKFKQIRDWYIAHDQQNFMNMKMGIVVNGNDNVLGAFCPPQNLSFLHDDNINMLLTMCAYALKYVREIRDMELEVVHNKYISLDAKEVNKLPEMKSWGI